MFWIRACCERLLEFEKFDLLEILSNSQLDEVVENILHPTRVVADLPEFDEGEDRFVRFHPGLRRSSNSVGVPRCPPFLILRLDLPQEAFFVAPEVGVDCHEAVAVFVTPRDEASGDFFPLGAEAQGLCQLVH